jgi:hypothetical protein
MPGDYRARVSAVEEKQKTKSDPAKPSAGDGVLQAVDQPAPVGIVADDLLPGVAPGPDVVDGALEFDAESSWHAGRLPREGVGCRGKTKNKV